MASKTPRASSRAPRATTAADPGKAKPRAAKKSAKTSTKTSAKTAAGSTTAAGAGFQMPDPAEFAKLSKLMTPEQAIELYKSNAKLALDIINAAVDSTAKMRKLQLDGEEQARTMQKKAARDAAAAGDPQALMAAGQSATQEAMQQAMQYWGQMFELIVDMQKRLFVLIEAQMEGVPGVKEAKAAMAMLPDLSKAKELIAAMRGVMSSGGSALESMQKVMGDFAKLAQQSMPGVKR